MIQITILFKNGSERLHNIPLGTIDDLTDEQKTNMVDEFAQLFSDNDTLRFSEKAGQRIYIDTNEVAHATFEIIEEEKT